VSALTILECRPNLRLTKTVARTPSGDVQIRPYDNTAAFRFHPHEFHSLDDLERLLRWAMVRPQVAVVRAAPKPDLDLTRWQKRRVKDRDGEPATLDDIPRDWLALDVDEFDGGAEDLPPFTEEPAVWAAAVRRLLGLQDVACVWQATSSAGLKTGARLRLWCLLDAPAENRRLGWWCDEMNAVVGFPLLDAAVTRPAQLVYTAAPILEGAGDPMAVRIGRLPGAERAHLHLPSSDPRGRGPLGHLRTDGAGVPVCGVQDALLAIGGPGGWYSPMVAAAGHAAVLQGAERMDVEGLVGAMRQRVEETADPDRRGKYDREFILGVVQHAQQQQARRERAINDARALMGVPARAFGRYPSEV
jgi:hypothetical protein